jgi:hypothetical protein
MTGGASHPGRSSPAPLPSGSNRAEVLRDKRGLVGTVRAMNVRRVAGLVAVHQGRVALVRQQWDEYREDFWLLSTSSTTHGENDWLAWNFTATVKEPHLAVADPDGEILEARWSVGWRQSSCWTGCPTAPSGSRWWPTSEVDGHSARTGVTTRPTSSPSSRWARGREVTRACATLSRFAIREELLRIRRRPRGAGDGNRTRTVSLGS